MQFVEVCSLCCIVLHVSGTSLMLMSSLTQTLIQGEGLCVLAYRALCSSTGAIESLICTKTLPITKKCFTCKMHNAQWMNSLKGTKWCTGTWFAVNSSEIKFALAYESVDFIDGSTHVASFSQVHSLISVEQYHMVDNAIKPYLSKLSIANNSLK